MGRCQVAKLTGVKTLDMKDGVIERVEYDGAAYARVAEPKAGDVAAVVEPWGTIRKGDYYSVERISRSFDKEYAYVTDFACGYLGDVQAFRKVEATPVPLKVGDSVRLKSEDGALAGFEAGDIVTVSEANRYAINDLAVRQADGITGFTTSGNVELVASPQGASRIIASYDDLAIGMTLKCVANDHGAYTIGNEYKIVSKDCDGDYFAEDDDGDADIITEYRRINEWTSEFEIVGDAPVAAHTLLKEESTALRVGDYAKVVDASGRNSGIVVGQIRTIVENDGTRAPYKAELLDGSDHDWFSAHRLVKATDAEVAQAKADAAKAEAERKLVAKWASIGRKVNEYRKGDVVKVTGGSGHDVGVYGEISADETDGYPSVKAYDGEWKGYTLYNYVELITPVEARFDRK